MPITAQGLPDPEQVTSTNFRTGSSGYLNRAEDGEVFRVVNHAKDRAYLISPEHYRRLFRVWKLALARFEAASAQITRLAAERKTAQPQVIAAAVTLLNRLSTKMDIYPDKVSLGDDGCFHIFFFGPRRMDSGVPARHVVLSVDWDGTEVDAAILFSDRSSGYLLSESFSDSDLSTFHSRIEDFLLEPEEPSQ